jgi:hypothetical protein
MFLLNCTMPNIGAEGELTEPARSVVGVEHLLKSSLGPKDSRCHPNINFAASVRQSGSSMEPMERRRVHEHPHASSVYLSA